MSHLYSTEQSGKIQEDPDPQVPPVQGSELQWGIFQQDGAFDGVAAGAAERSSEHLLIAEEQSRLWVMRAMLMAKREREREHC